MNTNKIVFFFITIFISFCLNTANAQQRRNVTQILTYQESQSAKHRLERVYNIVDQCGDYNLFCVSGRTNSGKIIKMVVDKVGYEIIPSSRNYTTIFFESEDGHDYFKVKSEEGTGVCDLSGKEIIKPNRRIKFLRFSSQPGYIGYYYVEGIYADQLCEGAYDMYGNEIIAPMLYRSILFSDGRFYSIENGEYVPLVYGLNKNGKGILLK